MSVTNYVRKTSHHFAGGALQRLTMPSMRLMMNYPISLPLQHRISTADIPLSALPDIPHPPPDPSAVRWGEGAW